jgi:hypothetical protein
VFALQLELRVEAEPGRLRASSASAGDEIEPERLVPGGDQRTIREPADPRALP